jgi:hypothetical protein
MSKDNIMAEFKIVSEPKQTKLVIHNNHVVAKAKKDVYEDIFDYAVKKLGGRKDKAWAKRVDRRRMLRRVM